MNKHFGKRTFFFLALFQTLISAQAQVNTVEFGKNRVQFQKFHWKFYQTENFNTYFSQDGLELGKYVAQIAEKELPELEEFVEYGSQRRINLVVYNNYNEYQQSNIGIGIDWQSSTGLTKLVNNKMLVFFDGNYENLRRQIRQGIAGVLLQNVLFGDDLGEFAANQALLDLPKWLTDGYIEYAAETWSTDLDDQLKSALLSGRYTNFYHFAFEKPTLAGHSFWYYIGNKYGRNKTTYLLYLSRIYRNLNSASNRIAKKKFKDVLRDFMNEEAQLYYKDIRARRVVPKGQLSVSEETRKKDFIRFNANPQPRSFTYAVTEFKQGKYTVVLNENFTNRKVLLTLGTRTREEEMNPNYPILAWDGKGTRLTVIYSEQGKNKMFVYDVVNRIKINKQELHQFDQVQDAKYMLNANTLLLSAVKSGQTDIFTYNIEKQTVNQITNDVYDDLDPSFVAFPNKTGIIFSSNRPNATAVDADTAIPTQHYNIFLIDNWNNSDFKQISQLTNVKFGNARFPSQYNTSHFTFVSDENGINNRYAGFFSTERAGLDTLIYIGDEVLRNPTEIDVDSTLKIWDKTDIDSVGMFSVTNDSAYVFPITNYQSSLLETRTAGDQNLVSEVTRQGDYKFLYRLRVDENTLRRRNVTARPTEFMKKRMEQSRIASGQLAAANAATAADSSGQKKDFFINEFGDERPDSSNVGKVYQAEDLSEQTILKKAKLYEYRPPKFFNDYIVASLNNVAFDFVNKYQIYGGGAGPITLSGTGSEISGLVRMGTADLFEDYKISGGFRIAPNLKDNDVLFEVTNLRKRWDLGVSYYRSNMSVSFSNGFEGKLFTNYYLGRARYAFDRVRSLRITAGPRFDRIVFTSKSPQELAQPDLKTTYGQISLEYVHDNTITPTTNIWNGLRWKVFTDYFTKLSGDQQKKRSTMFNIGIDARHYLPIYRNIIWATRGALDVSLGDQRVVHYLGGVDGWLKFGSNIKTDAEGNFVKYRYFEEGEGNRPAPDQNYAFQTLAVNLRGFRQNIANGNNAVVLNSEIRVPVFSTFMNRPINNAFLRNFQIVQFFDLGSAWNGRYNKIERPSTPYGNGTVTVRLKAGGIGPFAGGYGFGARSTLLGYFIRFDAAWQMNGFFRGKPQTYIALGLDF